MYYSHDEIRSHSTVEGKIGIKRLILGVCLAGMFVTPVFGEDKDPRCVISDCVTGYGKIVWEQGDPKGVCPGKSYEGYFQDGKPNGYGKLEYPCTGAVYLGQFQDGKEHGFGMLDWPNGNRSTGSWMNGKLSGIELVHYKNGNMRIGPADNHNSKDYGLTMLSNGTLKREDIYDISPTQDKGSPTGVYIPKDLDDCFKELNVMLNPALIEQMKTGSQEAMIQYHMGLGLWIRNNWGLWQASSLYRYLNELGLSHPDDMSGVILESYWRHLNNKPLDVKGHGQPEASRLEPLN